MFSSAMRSVRLQARGADNACVPFMAGLSVKRLAFDMQTLENAGIKPQADIGRVPTLLNPMWASCPLGMVSIQLSDGP